MTALALLLSPAGLAGLTDDQFRTVVEGLRTELAPTGVMEGILVEKILLFIHRMRRSAQAEPGTKALDRDWLRYESLAERGFWKAYNELMRGRRQQAREAKAAARAQPAAPPAPAARPAAPPAPAARPAEPARPRPMPAPAIKAEPFVAAEYLDMAILPPAPWARKPGPAPATS